MFDKCGAQKYVFPLDDLTFCIIYSLITVGCLCLLKKVKEKIIAAKRNGVKIIIFPSANRRDVEMISSNDVKGLEFHFVDKYNEIYDIAFACDDPTMGHHSSEEIQRSPSPPRKVLF